LRESRAFFGRDERVREVILRRRPLTLDLVGVDRVDDDAESGWRERGEISGSMRQ